MQPLTEKIDLAALGGFIAAVGIVIALYSSRQIREREKSLEIERRRRAFIGFLENWKDEMDRISGTGGRGGGFESEAGAFQGMISTFIFQSAIIKEDLPVEKRSQFDAWCQLLMGWDPKNISGSPKNDPQKKAVRDLIAFLLQT